MKKVKEKNDWRKQDETFLKLGVKRKTRILYISFCYSHSKLGTTASSFVVISSLFVLFIQLLFNKSKSSLIIDVLIDMVDALLSPPNQTCPSISCVKRRSSGLTRINDRSNERAFNDIVRGISGRHRPILINNPTKVRSQNG
jgi:hypothetical protein